MAMMKVYDVPPAPRHLMVTIAVWAGMALVFGGAPLGLVQFLLGGPGAGGPVSMVMGMLFSVVVLLAGLLLAAVLVTYVVLRLGGARRHHAAAAELINRSRTGNGHDPDA